jgi:cytochrome P450
MVEFERSYIVGEDDPVRAAIAAVEEPQPVFVRLGQECPVAQHSHGTTLFRFDDIVGVTRRPEILGEGAPGPSMGAPRPMIPLDLDGPEHARYRRLLDPLLAPRAIAYLEPEVRRLTNQLIDGFEGRAQVELYSELCVPLPCTVFLNLVGLPVEDLALINELKENVIRPQRKVASDAEAFELVVETGKKALAYLDEKLTAREQATAGDDFMSKLTTMEVDGMRLTHEQVLDVLWLLVIAGLDTVTSSLSSMFAWLAEHPIERHRLVDEPGIVRAAVEELMRYQTPVTATDRWATQDIEVGGHTIRAGEHITVSWAAANLDPEVFPDPLTVNFDRKGNRHIAFASGFHRCLGSHLARLEMRCVLEEFHRRIPDYEPVSDDPPRWVYESSRCPTYLPLNLAWAS